MISARKDLGLFVVLFVRGATGACNVCRNGGQIINPSHAFTMNDVANGVSVDWTCGWLEESVADVNPAGAQGEAFLCALAQLWAELECSCNGPPIAPLSDNVIDPNPACDLCAGSPLDYVPALLLEELVETGVAGRMPCGGLYNAMAEGVLSSSLCPTVRGNAGSFCCSVPAVDTTQLQEINNNADPTPNNPPANNPPANNPPVEDPDGTISGFTEDSPGSDPAGCTYMHSNCVNDQACCSGSYCALRVVGEDRICTQQNSIQRESVAGNQGGAGGAAKYGN
jgi:hypothetical protein